jgi:hypothetical protein
MSHTIATGRTRKPLEQRSRRTLLKHETYLYLKGAGRRVSNQ